MLKIVIIGAGSMVFTKNIIGDLLTFDKLKIDIISLVDIDKKKLSLIEGLVRALCKQKKKDIHAESTTQRRDVLRDATYVICTISVGGIDNYLNELNIPDKYGVNQNIGDTIGPGGVFRGLRVITEIINICKDMEDLCPNAILLQHSNPMAAICKAINLTTKVNCFGVCHSVQGTAKQIAGYLRVPYESVSYWCAGINHMAWFLKLTVNGRDIYPELRNIASDKNKIIDLSEYENVYSEEGIKLVEFVRFEILKHFGYFVSESPFHMSEYVPYFRKNKEQIRKLMVHNRWWLGLKEREEEYFKDIERRINNEEFGDYEKTIEYAPDIINSIENNIPFRANLNVTNNNLINNLPRDSCVEVPCSIDSEGIHPCYVGSLPEQCAALNRTNINVQELLVRAVVEKKKEYIYQAVKLDPLTSSILTLSEIDEMVDELIQASSKYLRDYK